MFTVCCVDNDKVAGDGPASFRSAAFLYRPNRCSEEKINNAHFILLLAKNIFKKHTSYCLSNAMHGQNINLPVCVSVCVCPSHFLSTRLQVRSLNGFFTVDSLKDADLRKDVPFGGLDDE